MDRRHGKKLTTASDQIVASYENGMSLVEIGKIYNCSPTTVLTFLKSLGISRRRRGPKKETKNGV